MENELQSVENEQLTRSPETDEQIDQVEAFIMTLPQVDYDTRLEVEFTPGIYKRTCLLKAGELWTSKIHKTEHPWFMLTGECLVYSEADGLQRIKGPTYGITKAGTRRVLGIIKDTVWVTVHANPDDETDLEVLNERLLEYRPLAATVPLDKIAEALRLATEPLEQEES